MSDWQKCSLKHYSYRKHYCNDRVTKCNNTWNRRRNTDERLYYRVLYALARVILLYGYTGTSFNPKNCTLLLAHELSIHCDRLRIRNIRFVIATE